MANLLCSRRLFVVDLEAYRTVFAILGSVASSLEHWWASSEAVLTVENWAKENSNWVLSEDIWEVYTQSTNISRKFVNAHEIYKCRNH